MQTYSTKINILEDLNIDINIEENKYNLPLESVFSMAARKNKKRSFLFVSKLLGKHYPIKPSVGILTGTLLANELTNKKYLFDIRDGIIKGMLNQLPNNKVESLIDYLQEDKLVVDKNTLFIGFAETATGLGHAVFNSFKNIDYVYRKEINYIHTTREQINELNSVFDFEEEHSHATTHLCYAIDKKIFHSAERIVLIDDEISTGKTNLNLIRSLHKVFPIKEFVCLSILDWRSPEQIQAYKDLENELNVKIDVISIIKGTISCNNKPIEIENITTSKEKKVDVSLDLYALHSTSLKYKLYNKNYYENFLIGTGRFGISSKDNKKELYNIINSIQLLDLNVTPRTLVMGFGEFIFIPMMMAHKLNSKCSFSSPSLSPVHVDRGNSTYPLKDVDIIECPYGINNHYNIYNINNDEFDNVILILERKPSDAFITQLIDIISSKGISNLSIIYFR